MTPEAANPYQLAGEPAAGASVMPSSFLPASQRKETQGYVLNHTALQIRSVSTSLEFYVGFLGMSLVFAINTGLFTAYYLGYPEDTDTCPSDMARTMGHRAGLLELIFAHEDTAGERTEQSAQQVKSLNGCSETVPGRPGPFPRFGFGHIGIRVPDVAATLLRAEQHGWRVLKQLRDLEPKDLPLPSWTDAQGRYRGPAHGRHWEGGFANMFAQIGFVEDPDGYVETVVNVMNLLEGSFPIIPADKIDFHADEN